jgi:hypothetical protein
MIQKTSRWFLCLFFLASCNTSNKQDPIVNTTTHTIKLTDSSRKKLITALEDIIITNARTGDTTISGKFVNQGKNDKGNFITVQTNDRKITLVNLLPLKEGEIGKLKRSGDNITVTYNQSNNTVKFLATLYEPQH